MIKDFETASVAELKRAIAWPLSLLILFNDPNGHGATRAIVLLAGVGLLVTTLPTAVVAWREPDPDEPEPLPV